MASERSSRLWDRLLDLLFPPRCPFCRSLLRDGERVVCGRCRKTLPWTHGADQAQRFAQLARCVSPLYYDGLVRRSLLRYKFSGLSAYAKAYAELLASCMDENALRCDLITWVPLGEKRLRERGYDQARLLAEEIASLRGLRCERLLVKRKDNPPQSGTGSPEKRRENVKGVYAAAAPSVTQGARVLIVDDIVTTGATLCECARMLKAAGAAEVSAITLARSKRDTTVR